MASSRALAKPLETLGGHEHTRVHTDEFGFERHLVREQFVKSSVSFPARAQAT